MPAPRLLSNTCTACTYAPQQMVLLPFVALVPALACYFKEVHLLETGFGRLSEWFFISEWFSRLKKWFSISEWFFRVQSLLGPWFFKNGYLLQTGFFQARSHAALSTTHLPMTHTISINNTIVVSINDTIVLSINDTIRKVFMLLLGRSPHKNCKNDLDDQT